jgi:hypothetical protein
MNKAITDSSQHGYFSSDVRLACAHGQGKVSRVAGGRKIRLPDRYRITSYLKEKVSFNGVSLDK